MSGILKRTVFIGLDRRNGARKHRPTDWASVVTAVGQCAEPFNWMARTAPGDNTPVPDTDDEINRVDNVTFTPDMQCRSVLSSGEVHGGYLMPRVDRGT